MAKEKIAPRTVTMDDGRIVEFPGTRRMLKSSIKTTDGKLQVRIDFENGETRLHTLRLDMLERYALHGAEQKLGDETSGIEKLEDAIEAVDQLMGRLDAGEWTLGREGGGSGMAGASVLARALVKVSGNEIGVVRQYLATIDARTKMALRVEPTVAAAIAAVEAEMAAKRAAAGKTVVAVDVAGALAKLQGLSAPAAA